MREVNNQQPSNMTPQVYPTKLEAKEQTAPVAPTETNENPKEIKDLSNMPAESLGRSQVAVADSIENDIKTMLDNPEMVEKANKFHEMAEKVLRTKCDEFAAEKATLLTDAYVNEFLRA